LVLKGDSRGADSDGDGVPDDIDNCRALANPQQQPVHDSACAAADAGAGADSSDDAAAADDGRDDANGSDDGQVGLTDAAPSSLPPGAPCGASSVCASGFCV